MVVPPAPDVHPGVTSSNPHDSAEPPDRDPPGPVSSGASPFRLLLLGALVVLLLASVGTSIWLLAGRSGQADDVQAERDAAMAQARQFMLRVNTYGPEQLDERGELPEYRELVEEVITPKFAASFAEGVTAAEQTVSEVGLGRTAQVYAVGVTTLDLDSATALVAGSFTNSYPRPKNPDERIEDEPAPFRVEVSLVKIEGTWLVDDFTPVTGEPQ
ncbi:MAG: hypothetical protein WKF72_03320 [Nocardioidaceae bacterium]